LNLPPEWRSQLKSVQLLGVINSKLLIEVGLQQFLQPIIDDLLKLQFGVHLQTRNEGEFCWRQASFKLGGRI
jgi:hypothetical protein